MTAFSLDTPSVATLKSEARVLREERAGAGTPMTHGAALEEIAHRHGYRDWNTARAALPERIPMPVEMGQRVKGTYLGQPFLGLVIGMKILPDMQHCEITVRFDSPVNVSRSELMGPILRRRVRATIDVHGVTAARTSDGEPHMRVGRA
jgi:hypothetical protein